MHSLRAMLSRRIFLSSAGGTLVSSLAARASAQGEPQKLTYDVSTFGKGRSNGWLPEFSDFSLATASTNRMAEIRPLPSETNPGGRFGYYLQGRNTSDDLFMFIKKPVVKLAPERMYDVSFYIEFASSAPSNCTGIGGAPGESVWLKAGAATQEPVAVLESGEIRLSVDKGNQGAVGRNAVLMGNIANGLPCNTAGGRFVLLQRAALLTNPVKADGSGSVWVFVGTDSGFEGTTEIYYAFIAVWFSLRA